MSLLSPRHEHLTFAVLGLVAVAACASRHTPSAADSSTDAGDGAVDADDGGVDAGALETPYSDYRATIAELLCEQRILCDVRTSPLSADFTCAAELDERPDPNLEAIERGTVTYDPRAATRCLQALRETRGCEIPPECGPVLEPQLPPGSSCSSLVECIDGVCGGSTCPRRCVSYPREGEDCSFLCVAGFECDFFRTWVCLPLAAEGMPCDGGFCQPGLICVDRVCRPRLSGDEWCASSRECVGRLVCNDTLCVEGSATGDACGEELHCATGHRCVDGRCVLLAAPGGPCVDRQCTGGYECFDNACTLLPKLDEPCRDEVGCVEGACVDGRCALPGEGEACDNEQVGRTCQGVCDDGVCGAIPGAGDPCARWCPAGLQCALADGFEVRCLPICS